MLLRLARHRIARSAYKKTTRNSKDGHGWFGLPKRQMTNANEKALSLRAGFTYLFDGSQEFV